MINIRILTNISLDKFQCDFRIDSPVLQDELFDYLTSLSYTVYFSQAEESDPDSRIMTISWESLITFDNDNDNDYKYNNVKMYKKGWYNN